MTHICPARASTSTSVRRSYHYFKLSKASELSLKTVTPTFDRNNTSSDPSTALAGRRGNGLLLVAASWPGWPSECEVEDASRAPLPCAAPRRTALPGSCHSPWWGGKASRRRGEKVGLI